MIQGLLGGASPAGAVIWRVRADGSGDQPTLAAAIAVAAHRDTLDLAAGLYNQTERLVIEGKTLLLRGAGIDQTIIQAAPHGNILYLHGPNNATEIRDLTFRGAVADQIGDPLGIGTDGGAINAEAADFTLARVRITECRAGVGGGLGGGIFMTSLERHGGAESAGAPRALAAGYILLEDVRIDNCAAGSEGGGLYAEGALFVLRRCRFEANDAVDGGGAKIFDSIGNVEECLFLNNSAEFFGGGLKVEQGLADVIRVEGNTFVGNRAHRGGAGVELFRTVNVTLRRNIFVDQGGDTGDAYACRPPGAFEAECNLVFNNRTNERVNCPDDPTLLEVDPRFCNPGAGDYRLCQNSPALEAPCGPLGAFGVGCTGSNCATPVRPMSWGGIKALHRR